MRPRLIPLSNVQKEKLEEIALYFDNLSQKTISTKKAIKIMWNMVGEDEDLQQLPQWFENGGIGFWQYKTDIYSSIIRKWHPVDETTCQG